MTTINLSARPQVPATPVSSTSTPLGRRIVNPLLGLVLGLALPTGGLAWVFGFDPIKKRINGRLWCSTADELAFVVKVKSTGRGTAYSDNLVCRKSGAVLRTLSDPLMSATIIGAAFLVSLIALLALGVALNTYGKLRRRVANRQVPPDGHTMR